MMFFSLKAVDVGKATRRSDVGQQHQANSIASENPIAAKVTSLVPYLS